MESNKRRVFYRMKNFVINIKVVRFKFSAKNKRPMQNLRNRYIQTELGIR